MKLMTEKANVAILVNEAMTWKGLYIKSLMTRLLSSGS